MNLRTEQRVKFWLFIIAKILAIILVIYKLTSLLVDKPENFISTKVEKPQNVQTNLINKDSISGTYEGSPSLDSTKEPIIKESKKEKPISSIDNKKITQVANIMNAPIVNNDVVLSMLLHKELINKNDIDWNKNAEFHIKRGKRYANETDITSKELYSQFIQQENLKELNDNWTDYYKNWILENAKMQTKSVSTIIEPNRITYEEGKIMIDLAKLKNTGFATGNLKKLLDIKKIDPKRTSLMLTNSPGVMGYYVYQNDKGFAQVNIEGIKKETHELQWKLELEVDNIEMIYYDDMKYLFYYVSPKVIHYKHPNETIWKTKKNFFVLNNWESNAKSPLQANLLNSKAFFNYDVLLSILLAYKLIDADEIDWKFFTSRNFSHAVMDKTKHPDYQYPKIFTNDFYAKYKPVAFPEGVYDYYKSWIVKNADTRIKSIYQPISKLEKIEKPESKKTFYKFTLGNKVSLKYSRVSQIIDFKEIESQKVSLNTLSADNSDLFFKNVFLIYPETSNLNILLELANNLKIEPFDFSKNWRVELNLNRVEFDKINNQGYVFCFVEPKAIHYKTYDGIWHITENFKTVTAN